MAQEDTKQFAKAITLFNEKIKQMRKMAYGIISDEKEKTELKQIVKGFKSTSEKFKTFLKKISQNKDVIKNSQELRFIGVISQDFIKYHYIILGINQEFENGESIDLKILSETAEIIICFSQVFKEVIYEVFGQMI